MPEREAPQASQAPRDLAARLREAAKGIDPDALADRAAALREGRETEERALAREQERVKELEKEREADSIAERDRGRGYSL